MKNLVKIKILCVAEKGNDCKAYHIYEDGTIASITVENNVFHSKVIRKGNS